MQIDTSEKLATNNREFGNIELPNPRKLKTMIRHFNRRTETMFIVNISKSGFFIIIQKKNNTKILTAKIFTAG